MEIDFARKVDAPFPTVEPNERCIRYDCQDCQGKGYVEGWVGVDLASLRCPGHGIIEHWRPLAIGTVLKYMREWTAYTKVRVVHPYSQPDPNAIMFTAINPMGDHVQLRADLDPDVVTDPGKPKEYYFNIWDRPAESEGDWQWVDAIQAELKLARKRKGA